MSNYDPYYEREYSRRYVREEERPPRESRYLDVHDSYPRSGGALVPHRSPRDSEVSVEEIRREFPPPGHGRRARSAEPGYMEEYEYRRDRNYDREAYDRDYDRDYDRYATGRRPASTHYEQEEVRSKGKSMSKQEKIIAAVAGAALLAGGKEIYDRYDAKKEGGKVERNALSSAALAGVGALAAYQGVEYYSKQQAAKDEKTNYILHRGRDGEIAEYYYDEEDGKDKKSNKNFLESALAATGLGAAVKQFTGGNKDDDKADQRSDYRGRGRSRSWSRSRSNSPRSRDPRDRDLRDTRSRDGRDGQSEAGGEKKSTVNQIQKSAMASLLAGASEAFRIAKEPGGWKGEKAKRVLTAAAGAATVDAAQGSDSGKLGMAQSVIGGLVGNRLINGSKSNIEADHKTGRSRSRSRARSVGGNGATGLAALATAGLGAFGAKKAWDHHQDSRSRSQARSPDSRGSSPERPRERSRSVVDRARNSLAKLGIGAGTGAVVAADDDRRRDQDDYDDRDRGSSRRPSRREYEDSPRSGRRHDDDLYDDDYRASRGRDWRDQDDNRSSRGGGRERDRSRGGKTNYTSDSSLGDSDDDNKRAKRLRGKQILTTGLATVATIHAAHGVYSSMDKRNARHKAVKEGRLSPAEARKLKTKAMMQDAASVGIAAMGIKGAIDEMKEAKHLTHECKEFQEKKAVRHEKRLERRQKLSDWGRKRSDSWSGPRRPARYADDEGYESDYDWRSPRYVDDNPYGAPYGPPHRSSTVPLGPDPGYGRYR